MQIPQQKNINNNYIFFFQAILRKKKMDSEESYSHAQKPSTTTTISGTVSDGVNNCFIQSIDFAQIKNSPNVNQIFCSLNELFKTKGFEQIEYGLGLLENLLKNGYSSKFIRYDESLRSIMNYFNKLANELEEQPKSKNQLKMLKVLSLISQILNQNPKFNFPFNKKFIRNIFLINSEFIQVSNKKDSILKILSVIFLALSKRTKLMKQFDLLSYLKSIVLDNFQLIQDSMTFYRFTKAIRNIIIIIPINMLELKKYKVFETVRRFMNQSEFDDFLTKLGIGNYLIPTVNVVKIQNIKTENDK